MVTPVLVIVVVKLSIELSQRYVIVPETRPVKEAVAAVILVNGAGIPPGQIDCVPLIVPAATRLMYKVKVLEVEQDPLLTSTSIVAVVKPAKLADGIVAVRVLVVATKPLFKRHV